MNAAISHLTRRGIDLVQQSETYEYQMPTWGIVILGTTGLVFLVTSTAIEYTFGRLIPALMMIESPEALLYEPLDTIDPDTPINKLTDPELIIVKQEPITSSFRRTIKHLHSKAGFRARFRGIALFAVISAVLTFASGLVGSIPFVPRALAHVFGSVLIANLKLTWTHIVISDPSPKPWFRRLPKFKAWKKVAGPTALFAAVQQGTLFLILLLARVFGLVIDHKTAANLSGAGKSAAAGKGFAFFIICLVLALLVLVPAKVMLIRVQASLLPDDQESIVPFDRSFGGKVTPEIVGGSGVIGVLDAWKTFGWNSRLRLIKAYAKVFAMQCALFLFFFGVIVAQIFIIVGKSELKKIIHNPENGDETETFV